MSKRLWMLAAAAAFLVVAKPAPDVRAAAAKLPMLQMDASNVIEVRKRRHGHARRFYRHRHFHRPRHFRRHRHRHRIWRHRGPRFAIYVGPRYSCAWLRRRAIITGSRYWWRRYRWCRGW